MEVASANRGEVLASARLVNQLPRQVVLTGDRAYDVPWFRQRLKSRSIYPLIRYRKTWMTNWQGYKPAKRLESVLLYKQRYKVERTFAWLEKFKRLNIRYERLGHLYKSFCFLAASILLLHSFTR